MDLLSLESAKLACGPAWVFLCVSARLGPIFLLAPPTRSQAIPARIRAILILAFALLLTPSAMASAATLPSNALQTALAVAGESMLGLLLGSVLLLAIASAQIAGQIIGQLAGFNVAASAEDEQLSLFSNLFGWLAVVLLLTLGGHRYFLHCCFESFSTTPIGTLSFQEFWFSEIETVLRHAFVVGLRIAAPFALGLLLANIVTALLSRTIPQLNVLAVGFNINALVLLTLLMVSIGGVGWVFQSELSVWIESCQRIVAGS